jgi:hypothetical protein
MPEFVYIGMSNLHIVGILNVFHSNRFCMSVYLFPRRSNPLLVTLLTVSLSIIPLTILQHEMMPTHTAHSKIGQKIARNY